MPLHIIYHATYSNALTTICFTDRHACRQRNVLFILDWSITTGHCESTPWTWSRGCSTPRGPAKLAGEKGTRNKTMNRRWDPKTEEHEISSSHQGLLHEQNDNIMQYLYLIYNIYYIYTHIHSLCRLNLASNLQPMSWVYNLSWSRYSKSISDCI